MAANSISVMNPNAAPMNTCSAALAMMSAVSIDGTLLLRYGVMGSARPTESSAFTGTGMSLELNGGQSTIHAPARAAPSMIAISSALATSTFMSGTTPPAP
jgi:hypothetical protein